MRAQQRRAAAGAAAQVAAFSSEMQGTSGRPEWASLTGREVRVEMARHVRDSFVSQTAPPRPKVSQRTPAQARHRSERFGTEEQRREALMQIRMGRRAAAEAALSANTWRQNASAWAIWEDFCVVRKIDPNAFGQLAHDEAPRPSEIAFEDSVLADFGVFVVNNPRRKGKSRNLGKTAAQYISHIRTHYEFRLNPSRRPGSGTTTASGGIESLGFMLRRCLAGLKKKFPSDPRKNRRAPVLRHHMIAIKRGLDMTNAFDAVLWAFMCTAWQGGRRSAELIRGMGRSGAWGPQYDMHRGRVTVTRGDGDEVRRVTSALAPDKTDPSGEDGHEVYLPYSDGAQINAAATVLQMLRLDPTERTASEEMTPLFRDTRPGRHGKPMTHGDVFDIAKKMSMRVGMERGMPDATRSGAARPLGWRMSTRLTTS